MMTNFMSYVLSALMVLTVSIEGLICAENDATVSPKPDFVNCTECNMCVTSFPLPLMGNDAEDERTPSMFGTGEHVEDTAELQSVFGLSTDMYTILSTCILEQYNFGGQSEFMFRCFCKTAGCNSAHSLTNLVNRQMKRSIIREQMLKTNRIFN